MIKAIIMFVFGNALWDHLVEVFGSPEEVVMAALVLVGIIVFVRYHKEIFSLAVILFILYVIFH